MKIIIHYTDNVSFFLYCSSHIVCSQTDGQVPEINCLNNFTVNYSVIEN